MIKNSNKRDMKLKTNTTKDLGRYPINVYRLNRISK